MSQVCEIFLAGSTWEELFSIKCTMTTGERVMKRTCGVGSWCEQSCPAHRRPSGESACTNTGFGIISPVPSVVTLMRQRNEGSGLLAGAA